MRLGNEKALWLLFAVVFVMVPIYGWTFWRKAKALKILASADMLKRINISVSLKRQVFKAAMLIVGFVVIVVALTQPGWNPEPRRISRKGRDIVILLDTSRSMLAEDIRPNRLERARIAIADLLAVLAGDRISLITFAGNSTVKCPLTQDYAFVRMALAEITTESTSRGGTMIGDAIRKATDEVFDKHSRKYKDIILITDGDDHDSFPIQAAEKAAQEGVRIIAIGLGDAEQGARIPITAPDGRELFLKDNQGKEVWSKLDDDTLRQIAFASVDGKYLAVKTGTFNLDEIYEDIIASAEQRELASATMMQYDEKFQVFLALGILIIVCEMLISERKKV